MSAMALVNAAATAGGGRTAKTVLKGELPVTIGDILTRIGARAQLDIRPTGHSPRRGLVTEPSRASNPDTVAERQGGWAPALRSYAATASRTTGSRRTPCTGCCRTWTAGAPTAGEAPTGDGRRLRPRPSGAARAFPAAPARLPRRRGPTARRV
ncbi:hypothetical protein LT493_25960 [Streptomyces tricolor]|nr:hypothetical protein [Streptomyces tricolor]